ncbi:exodeoxyribonuclease VII large subunit [Spiroplasma endosymbiont of Aspidapion aeneum]|uniref:exodeoxyribonuclease VII large subunit n=1 Tax=Spiroplasma endosymbiont of Aspidapion aeneum TaxID=3066276 RepID=UPI00313D3DC3
MSTKYSSIQQLADVISDAIRLNENLNNVEIYGEISDFSTVNGHSYFNLKDPSSSISAVLWKSTPNISRELLKNGVSLWVTGDVTYYGKANKVNFTVKKIQIDGIGEIEELYNQRVIEVTKKGWTDRKRKIVKLPRNIAIISGLGAFGLQDALTTIKSRNANVNLFIFSSLVQGDSAIGSILKAIKLVNKLSGTKIPKIDTLLLIRGGGKIDDLWCFNDLKIAEAIYNSEISVITGIGHDPDVTIADLVADLRGLTPTDAATKAIEDKQVTLQIVSSMLQQNKNIIESKLDAYKGEYNNIVEQRKNIKNVLNNKIKAVAQQFFQYKDLIEKNINWKFETLKREYLNIQERIELINPMRPLDKGFAIVRDKNTNKLIKNGDDIIEGNIYKIEFKDSIVNVIRKGK